MSICFSKFDLNLLKFMNLLGAIVGMLVDATHPWPDDPLQALATAKTKRHL